MRINFDKIVDTYISSLAEASKIEMDLGSLSYRDSTQNLKVGEIWSIVHKTDENVYIGGLVCITHTKQEHIRVVYVSDSTWFLSDEDIYVPDFDSPTHTPLLLCTWFDIAIKKEYLAQRIGILPQNTITALRLFLQHLITEDVQIKHRESFKQKDFVLLKDDCMKTMDIQLKPTELIDTVKNNKGKILEATCLVGLEPSTKKLIKVLHENIFDFYMYLER